LIPGWSGPGGLPDAAAIVAGNDAAPETAAEGAGKLTAASGMGGPDRDPDGDAAGGEPDTRPPPAEVTRPPVTVKGTR